MTDETLHGIRVNEDEVPWQHFRSPEGRYEGDTKELTAREATDPLLLCAEPRVDFAPDRAARGRPFEVELVRLAPGCRICPKHIHSAQWEYYIVLAGRGRMIIDDGGIDLRPGDHVLQPPGWAHTMENPGDEELLYYVIADNPSSEWVHYPDSDKWAVSPERRLFRMDETDYYDGEE